MKKYLLLFGALTILFTFLAFIVKSKFYYFPYPNLIEYVLAALVCLITLISVTRKSKISRPGKLWTGLVAIVVFMGAVNILNLIFVWHPLNLRLPFSQSQSFEVDHEPYQWQTASPESTGCSTDSLSKFFEKLDKWERLRALVVVKDNKLVVEKYFSGATSRSAFNIHSITKSVTSALVGIAIQKHHIQTENAYVMPFFPEFQSRSSRDLKELLTINHLLSMTGGWAGGDGFQTTEQCIVDEPLGAMPGAEFNYFTGSQNILSAILSKSTAHSTKDFADLFLFQPLGIRSAFWRKAGGYYVGGDESYYTARDLARFGFLLLNYGRVDGKQIIDSSWVEKTFTNYTETSKSFRSLDSYSEVGYGYCWWILRTKEERLAYAARGKGGQHIILIPDRNVVAVIIQEWIPWKKNESVENKLIGELIKIL